MWRINYCKKARVEVNLGNSCGAREKGAGFKSYSRFVGRGEAVKEK